MTSLKTESLILSRRISNDMIKISFIKALIIFLLLFIEKSLSQNETILKSIFNYSVHFSEEKTIRPPLLILLHGYGSNEADLFCISQKFDKRFLTISIEAPNKLGNESYCWYSIDFLPNGEFKYDYKQTSESRNKLFSFISKASTDIIFYLNKNSPFIFRWYLPWFKIF